MLQEKARLPDNELPKYKNTAKRYSLKEKKNY